MGLVFKGLIMEPASSRKSIWLGVVVCLIALVGLGLWCGFLFVPGFLKPDRAGKLVDIYILPRVDLFVIEVEIDGQNEKFGVASVANAGVVVRADGLQEVTVLLQDKLYGFGDIYQRVTILAPPSYAPILQEFMQKAWQGESENPPKKEDLPGDLIPREYF